MILVSENQTDNEDYWQSELGSLGIESKRKNETNDNEELEALAENLKQVYFQDYKTAYDDDPHFDFII